MTLTRWLAVLVSAVGFTGCGDKPQNGFFRVCLGDADPPRSEKSGNGFDVDTAKLLAERLNHTLQIIWLPRPNPREIESSDIDFSHLVSGVCDAQFSIPGRNAIIGQHDELILSVPYYGTSFELLPPDASLAASKRIAVRANTVAHVLVDAKDMAWTMQPDSASVAHAVASGDADAGLIWGPDLALIDVMRNEAFVAPPVLRWNQHLAFRASNGRLRDKVNNVLPELADEIISLLAAHGIPPHPPFDSFHQSTDLEAL